MSIYSRDAINIGTLKQALNEKDETKKVVFIYGEHELVIDKIEHGEQFLTLQVQLVKKD